MNMKQTNRKRNFRNIFYNDRPTKSTKSKKKLPNRLSTESKSKTKKSI